MKFYRMNFFKIISRVLCLASFVVFTSCNNSFEDDSHKEDDSYKKKIVGEWHYYSGSIISIFDNTSDDVCHDILRLNDIGNFTEKVYYQNTSQEFKGNWKVDGRKITINDFEGESHKQIVIVKATEDELELAFGTSKALFVKRERMFDNLESRLIGAWYTYVEYLSNPQYNPYYYFRNDGTAFYRSYMSGVPQQTTYLWHIDDNGKLILDYDKIAYQDKVLEFEYFNKYNFKWVGYSNCRKD